MKRKTHEEFVDELKIKNPAILVRGTYVNSSVKTEVQCSRCNNIWSATPNSLLQGHGCPLCANNQRKTHQQFQFVMRKVNPFIEIVGTYESAMKPLKIRCTICGNEWMSKPNRLLNGAQCQNCIKPHTSFMEQFMLIAFRRAMGKEAVVSRDKEAIGLELDIYIPRYKLALEPGTWLYHKNKADSIDSIKRKKCSDAGIRILTVYDTFPENETPPFESDCYVFTGFLNEPGYKRIITFLSELMSEVGIHYEDLDWMSIANEAYAACHYNAHDSFMKALGEIAPDIEILEEYKGSNIPIQVNKLTCTHKPWKARPHTLLKGIGCPECGRITAAKTRTRTQEEFEEELRNISPTIDVLSSYTNITDRVNVQCKVCGHVWSPLAYSLISGKSCPHCSALKGAQKRTNHLSTKTTEQFKQEVANINDDIIILGEYINNKTKIRSECKRCGHCWDVVPASLLNGHGCPVCAHKKKV